MAARLIINADDFGLTPGINRAIAELHSAGVLNSATLMANGPAFEDAIATARAHPRLGVGCHIVLTDGKPVLAASEIPSLLAPDRKSFRPSLSSFCAAVLLGRVSREDMEREAFAQIEKLQRAGINVSHVDTHKHTHILPRVARSILVAAERAGVHAIRNPFEEPWSMGIGRSRLVRRLQLRIIAHLRPDFEALPQLRNRMIATTQGTIGISATGRLDATTLQQILQALPDGLWEMVCHPGYNDHDLRNINTRLGDSRDIERLAILTAFASPSAPRVIHYGNLIAQAPIVESDASAIKAG